jgi:carbamoyl-phosphate synthase small subunit
MVMIKLVLENGLELVGKSIGYDFEEKERGEVLGEIVFNTSMTGYQEVFTDPSYCDQIVTMTYPLIGNYGICQSDYESLTPHLKGIIIKEECESPSNWRNQMSLSTFLKRHKILGISGIDTRQLTKVIRSYGTMKAKIVRADQVDTSFSEPLKTNQIQRVSVKSPQHYPGSGVRVVMIDFGYKKNILTSLIQRGCDVIIAPYNITLEEIEKFNPDGILLSNGPGDPKEILEVIPTIQKLQNKYPLFAICMGHQIFALANNADTEKMKFGHRGANHPVKDFENDRVYITSQNHGYAVSLNSIEKSHLTVTQVNLNDKSIEGLKHKTLDASSVQYHPEASPGPNDTKFLFDNFINLIETKIRIKGSLCQ